MAHFSTINNHDTPISEIWIPVGTTKRFHLVDVKARVSQDIAIESDNSKVATANLIQSPFNGPKGIWTVDITAKSKGNAKLDAKHKQQSVAYLKITADKPVVIKLPDASTEKGMLTRLLLAESRTPSAKAKFSKPDIKLAMQWMIIVVNNRKNDPNPRRFMAEIGDNKKWDNKDIVTAIGQFHGFKDYPKLLTKVKGNIDDMVAIANNYSDTRQKLYAEHINLAISVASATPIKGPSKNGLYGWRTLGSAPLRGNFTKYKDLAGQTFYTLK